MYNLKTVFNFEVIRTLKKKSFWIMAMAFPILMGTIFAISYFSSAATDKALEETKNQKFSITITDESGLVNKEIVKALGANESPYKQASIDLVKNGKLDAYFFYPKDLSKDNVEVYAKDAGLFDNGRYSGVAKIMIQQSVVPTVDAQTTTILQDKLKFSSTTYKDGKPFDGFKELIAPGIFLVLFFLLLSMFSNQMLTSTTEEKENRITEMILTTIQARTLIIGKILSLMLLAFIQVSLILVPTIIAYLFFREQLALPNFDLSNIPLNPIPIAIGAAIFACSFMFFTGLLVAVGAVAPTAKEASSFFGVIMISIFAPLYAVSLFISAPQSTLVKVLTFFPLTAPLPLMLRNAVGNLSLAESIIGIIILAVSAIVALTVAIRLFHYGVLAYSSRIKLSALIHKK